MNLKDKVVFITGAGGGIGRETALKCAEYGASVALVDISEEMLQETKNLILEKGGAAIALCADITNRASVKAAVDAVVAEYGKIDCLFNNAGVLIAKKLEEITDEQVKKILEINVLGTFCVATEVAAVMRKAKKGRIVTTASISSFHVEYGNGMYSASKAAVATLAQAMAAEWSADGITSVAVSPGAVRTPMLERAFEGRAQAEGKDVNIFYAEATKGIPMGRFAEPTDIAEFVAWLFDERSYYINGNNILIDGGKIIG